MKRLLLILLPYLIFCLFFSLMLVFTSKDDSKNIKNSVNKPVIQNELDSLNLESDSL